MSARDQRAAAGAAELKDAVMNLPASDSALNQALPSDAWRAIGKASIANWVDDAERGCKRIAGALDVVDAEGDTDHAREEIEDALGRITSTREKLEAVFVLCFGVPSLKSYGKKSVRFEPDTDGIKEKLVGLATSHPAARELADAGKALAEHPAVTLRNQLTHQLAAISDAVELCWIDIAHIRGGAIIGWSGGPLYAEGVLDSGPITHEALWERAVTGVEECFGLLVRTFGVMAALVREAAVLEPPQRVYKDEDTGEVSLTDPRSDA